jgi:HlyD family secretion protein
MRHPMVLFIASLLATALLAACSESEDSLQATEVMQVGALRDTLRIEGELRAAETTVLNVPGKGFEARNLEFMVLDGSRVEKDQLVARFSAEQAEHELSKQERQLLRNAFKLANAKASAQTQAAQIITERNAIDGELSLSERYAELDQSASWVSQHELLDKLQDLGLLQNKRSTANWRIDHQREQASANDAVTLAERQTVQTMLDRNRDTLKALELFAPHAGVFRLNRNWDGSKIQIGGSAWAGNDFASLPNLENLIAFFKLPQVEASGLAVGQTVELRLLGTGKTFTATLSKVGASASVISRESPVKYVDLEASFDAKHTGEFKLTPGMGVEGVVVRVDAADVLTVPNTAVQLAVDANAAAPQAKPQMIQMQGAVDPAALAAIMASAGKGARIEPAKQPPEPAKPIERKASVWMSDGSVRSVVLGAGGNARSVVLSGLKAGEVIRVLRPADDKADQPAVENVSADKAGQP